MRGSIKDVSSEREAVGRTNTALSTLENKKDRSKGIIYIMYDKCYEHHWAPKTLPEGSKGGGLGE